MNADTTEVLDGGNDHILENNLYAYCFNNPINMTDEDGMWPTWATKVLIGAVALTAAVAITVATGGTAAPLLIGAAISTASGSAISAVGHRVSTGSWKGAGGAALNGAADGFMWGGVGSLAGSTVGAVKAVSAAKKGVTIGRNMTKVRAAAKISDTGTYKAMKGYNSIKKISTKLADNLSFAHNKAYINRMMKLGSPIYDSGLNGFASAGRYYGMELSRVSSYYNYVRMY